MLKIKIPAQESFNSKTREFINFEGCELELEHSLASLAKWESKWCKPFHSKFEKTSEETLDYIRCMTLTPNVDPIVYSFLTKENVDDILNYIQAPMTSMYTPPEDKNKVGGEQIRAELIYYWMITLGIWEECQYWHLNRLLAVIRMCAGKNAPAGKRSKQEMANNFAAINAARRKRLNSKG